MSPEVARAERARGVAAIALVTLLWSLNFVAARPAALAFDPVVLTFLRATAAALVFSPWLLRRGGRATLTWANLRAALPLGVACILANQVLFLLASSRTSPSHVALVIATIPVWVTILARLRLGERIARGRAVGIAVAFAGVALLALSRGGSGSARPSPTGDLFAMGAALAFAWFTVGNKALVARAGAFPATVLVYLAGSLLLLPAGLVRLVQAPPVGLGMLAWASAGYLVVGATLLAYPLFSYALARLTASRVAVFTYLQPALAALLSWAIGWETFPPLTVVGAVLAVGGVALAQRRYHAPPAAIPDRGRARACAGCCG